MIQFAGLCLAVGAMVYNFLDKARGWRKNCD
jgi:hypothetical protein